MVDSGPVWLQPRTTSTTTRKSRAMSRDGKVDTERQFRNIIDSTIMSHRACDRHGRSTLLRITLAEHTHRPYLFPSLDVYGCRKSFTFLGYAALGYLFLSMEISNNLERGLFEHETFRGSGISDLRDTSM